MIHERTVSLDMTVGFNYERLKNNRLLVDWNLQNAKLNTLSGFSVASCNASEYKSSASCTRGVGGDCGLAAGHGTDLRQNWRGSWWQRDILGWRTSTAA